jgi:hypothetical protein
MKVFFIIAGILCILFLVFQTYLSMATDKTETQNYQVIKKEKGFEIRFYPSATMATVKSNARSYKQLGSSGFRQLASYIFGGNDANQQIAMTSPVHMQISDSDASMSFVMPAQMNTDNLPSPDNPNVMLHSSKDEYVAVIQFGGFASDEDIQKQTEKLTGLLRANHIEFVGPFRYLGYNPPYQILNRKNEIMVTVKWNKQ